jgi:hypothetical protein
LLARPGDWCRDRIPAALEPGVVDRWIGACCLEVFHVGAAGQGD